MENTTFWMAFIGGLLSFLSPCILPVAPGYLGIISGVSLGNLQTGQFSRRRILLATAAFILGFTLVFTVMGLGSSYLGQLLRGSRGIFARLSGVVVILLGLHQAGWLTIPWLYQERRIAVGHSVGLAGAFLAGLAFSLGWTPCIGPILGSILALAGSEGKLGSGIILLLVYSLGLAVPFLLLALAFDRVAKSMNRLKPYLKYLEWASGSLLILMGLLLLTGSFLALTGWFMRMTGGWSPENWIRK